MGVIRGTGFEARICYVRAFDDPEWRKANGVPPKPPRREYPLPKAEQRRRANVVRLATPSVPPEETRP